jgi:hypothetical protein
MRATVSSIVIAALIGVLAVSLAPTRIASVDVAAAKKGAKPPTKAFVRKTIYDRYVVQNTVGDRQPQVTVTGVKFLERTKINPSGDTSAGAKNRVRAFAFRASTTVTPPGSSQTFTKGDNSTPRSYFFFYRDSGGKWTFLTGGSDLL